MPQNNCSLHHDGVVDVTASELTQVTQINTTASQRRIAATTLNVIRRYSLQQRVLMPQTRPCADSEQHFHRNEATLRSLSPNKNEKTARAEQTQPELWVKYLPLAFGNR